MEGEKAEGAPQKPGPAAKRWARLRHGIALLVLALAAWALWKLAGVKEDGLWMVQTVDEVVVYTILIAVALLALGIALSLVMEQTPAFCQLRSELTTVGGVVLVILTLHIAYATFRNQTRLAAETSLNEDGMSLYDLEMAHDGLRCLYDNYGHVAPDRCLDALAQSEADWSRAIFYVEETWSLLQRGVAAREEWGATFAQQVGYWIRDVEKDPSGLFSYYLLSSADSWADAQTAMKDAGVNIRPRTLCDNYFMVRAALERHRAAPADPVAWCGRPPAPAAEPEAVPAGRRGAAPAAGG